MKIWQNISGKSKKTKNENNLSVLSEKVKIIINQLILTLLCCAFCLNVMLVETHLGEKKYFYWSCIFLFVIILFFRRTKWYKARIIIPAVVAALTATYYLIINNSGWGPVYRAQLISKYLAYILAMIFVMDVIYSGKKTLPLIKKPFFIFTFLVFCVALILKPMETEYVIFPMLALYLTPIDKVNWKRLMLGISIGIYFSFVMCITYSLRVAPDNYSETRYVGSFYTLSTSGLLCGTAILSVTFLIFECWKYEKMRMYLVPALCGLYIYPVIMLLKIDSRTSELGIIFLLIFIFIFINKRKSREIAARAGISLLVGALCISLLVSLSKNVDEDSPYLFRRMNKLISVNNGESVYSLGIIPKDNAFMNAFDAFSSGRISIWIVGMRQVTWFGNNEVRVVYEDILDLENIHNTFLDYYVRYGWIGGTLLIMWFFWFLIKAVIAVRKGNKGLLYPLLWMAYCFGFFIFTSQPWERPMSFMLLLFQYPFLVKQYDNYEEYCESEAEKCIYVFDDVEDEIAGL